MSDSVSKWLSATDEEVGPACMLVLVPPTIDMSERFREAYAQGYRHALSDVRAELASRARQDKQP